MKKYKHFFSGVVFTLVLVLLAGTVMAKSSHETIKVLYNNIKLVVNGETVVFGKDGAGKKIEPFIYNGTTYLPVRAAGEALGKEVKWDGKNQTVYLDDVKRGDSSTAYMTDVLEPFGNKNPKAFKSTELEKIEILGKKYEAGYGQKSERDVLRINLDSQYKSLNFKLGAYKLFKNDAGKFKIFLDDKIYKEFEVTKDGVIQDITIDVTGVNQIRFEFPDFLDTYAAIGNPILTK